MKQAYHAANPVDAQLVVDWLAAYGIVAHVQGQYLSGALGELPVGELLRVWVEDGDLASAKALIAQRGREELGEGAILPLFETSWQRAWHGLGAEGEGLELRDRLLDAWSEQQRQYHTARHLADCLSLLEPVLELAEQPAEVEIALWFHDAVYALRAGDNEAQSAAWATRALLAAGVDVERVARVDALVLATRHAALPATPDERLLVDIDLAILGADRERFDEYEVQVRQEYSWVPGPLFRRKRREILAGFLARSRIYSTPYFIERLEAPARANLEHSLRQLRPWWQRLGLG